MSELQNQVTIPEPSTTGTPVFEFDSADKLSLPLQDYTRELLTSSHAYLSSLMGENAQYLSNKFAIRVNNSADHSARGILVFLSKDRMEKAMTQSADIQIQQQEQSKLIHELVHNLTDDEEFPMMAELIYLAENRNQDRIKEILSEHNLPPQYTQGLQKIASWCFTKPEDLSIEITHNNVQKLKTIFRSKMATYCKEDLQAA